MTAIWFFCLFPEARDLFNNQNEVWPKYIVGFCGLSFLPIGYLITIFSQAWYYSINSRSRIHCLHWRNLPDDKKKKIREKEEDFGNLPQDNEPRMEAILTYYDRTKIDSLDLDTNKFLSEFSTKRYDVIAINNGFIWATCLSFICALCLGAISLDMSIKWNRFSVWFAIILALLIIAVLFTSGRILQSQIIEIGRRKLREINV